MSSQVNRLHEQPWAWVTCAHTRVIWCTRQRRVPTVNDVTETLQQLLERRLRELGARRGRDTLSLREVWQTLPSDAAGKRPISYELVRRVRENGHTNISDRAADAIATMLDVAVSDVLTAAGQRPRLGRFELPRRADRLNDRERDVVVSVVDAILQAADADRPEGTVTRLSERAPKVPEKRVARKRDDRDDQ